MDVEKQELSNSISPVVKRRSSLFSKRLSGSNFRRIDAVEDAVISDVSPLENGCAEVEITLKEYIAKLGSERKDWKAVKQARKKRMKASEKSLADGPLVLKWEESQEFLTDEDKHFISQLPDHSATLQKLEEAEQNLLFYEHYRNVVSQTAVYLVNRLEVKTTAENLDNRTSGENQ